MPSPKTRMRWIRLAQLARLMPSVWLGVLLAAPAASAELIRLKNGNTMDATVTGQNEREITVDVPGAGAMTLSRGEIASIEASPKGPPGEEGTPVGEDATAPDAQLAVFKNAARGVRICYPKGWHVMETADRHPYLVTIEPTPPDRRLEVMAPVVIELFKFYHASLTTPFGRTSEEIVTRYMDGAIKSGKGTVVETTMVHVQGVKARLSMVEAADPRNPSLKLKMFILAAVKDDVLVGLFCQSQEDEFERRRELFRSVVARVEPFSKDPAHADNAQLDRESGRMANEAMAALKADDGRRLGELFEQALRINPGDAATHMNLGGTLFALSRSASGQMQAEMLERSERELLVAAQYFEAGGVSTATAPVISQAYFLLGEIAYFARHDFARAQGLYQQALRFAPHKGAEDALKRSQTP